MRRDLVFHLADGAMARGLTTFFERENWHHALGCRRFEIDPANPRDFWQVAGRHDDSLFQSAHRYLDAHRESYERAVIILDADFGISPGAAKIRETICTNMQNSGWAEDRFEVIVIEPMLEMWLWMESDHVAQAFGHPEYSKLRERLIEEKLWEPSQAKPIREKLKEARDLAAKLGRTRSGRAAFANVFKKVSSRALERCTEPSFVRLRDTLRYWFPKEAVPQQ